MRKRVLSVKQIERYIERLRIEEKAEATLEKYRRDIYAFFNFLPPDKMLKKELLISYKKHLKSEKYAVSSINSMLVAVNGFVAYLGASDCKVKLFKQQRSTFCDENRELTREEYLQLEIHYSTGTAKTGGSGTEQRQAAQNSAAQNFVCTLASILPGTFRP